MSFALPLGFLGLIGIAVLLLIYFLKPNYQQKVVSSTFIWKLSLKYRKKKLPISRLRNILIIICQILTIVACAFILASPVKTANALLDHPEKIMVLDASASMRAQTEEVTRFERAVKKLKEDAQAVISQEGYISVIYAGQTSRIVAQRVGAEEVEDLMLEIDEWLDDPDDSMGITCSYGESDIKGAMELAEGILYENPFAELVVYTDTNYIDDGSATIVNVSDELEWNAAILNVKPVLDENYYSFYIDVACYGEDKAIMVYCDVYGVNNDNLIVNLSYQVQCEGDKTTQIVLPYREEGSEISDEEKIYAFDYARVYVEEMDSYSSDDEFYVYGGRKPELKILYCSDKPNTFVSGFIRTLRGSLIDKYDITISEARKIPQELKNYDLYIFEHKMPSRVPTDGVVYLLDPDGIPSNVSVAMDTSYTGGQFTLSSSDDTHPVLSRVNAENITVTRYNKISRYEGFDALLYGGKTGTDPVLLTKNQTDSKIAIMSFSVHYSNITQVIEFPILMFNMFNYFFPTTVESYSCDVYEEIEINARGESVELVGPGVAEYFETFPATYKFTAPGTYTLNQSLLNKSDQTENIYVRLPASESNICKIEDELETPFVPKPDLTKENDLYFYFALALVSLIFIEWLLHMKEKV